MAIHEQIIGASILLLAGYVGGKLARLIKLPAVVGYLITGIILGPNVTNLIPMSLNKTMGGIKVLGLALIALIIGGELHWEKLRRLGKSVGVITITQVAGAFIVVFLTAKFFLHLSFPVCLLLGAMASATAPASPVAVVREYKARGPLTSTLLAVVALDDAACIALFTIVVAVVGIKGCSTEMFTTPLFRVGGSIIFGAVLGIIMVYILKLVKDRHEILILLVGAALLGGEIGEMVGFSALLLCMVMGLTVANFHSSEVFTVLEDVELPIFVVFFALAGASLRLDVLTANWLIPLIYIIARGIGKVGGVFAGAAASGAEKVVQKYLGFAMFSKAGLTIGLVLIVQSKFPEFAALITAIELSAIAVCELIGPIGTRYALVASGEAQEK
ncbi:MAG: cation:proton antiporter [Actinomycetota bacterium]|nr:cation:proton antiporter [Actinomycetota bacterium]